MRDADGDDRADRVVLTYSERVNHPADADGKYPLKVGSYGIRSVGAARRSTTLTIRLKEKPSPDIAGAPAVTCPSDAPQK